MTFINDVCLYLNSLLFLRFSIPKEVLLAGYISVRLSEHDVTSTAF